jgi:hypothetical protein
MDGKLQTGIWKASHHSAGLSTVMFQKNGSLSRQLAATLKSNIGGMHVFIHLFNLIKPLPGKALCL